MAKYWSAPHDPPSEVVANRPVANGRGVVGAYGWGWVMGWILILTILGADSYSQGTAVTSVVAFSTRDQCMSAADSWLKQMRAAGAGSRYDFRAMCAQAGLELK